MQAEIMHQATGSMIQSVQDASHRARRLTFLELSWVRILSFQVIHSFSNTSISVWLINEKVKSQKEEEIYPGSL